MIDQEEKKDTRVYITIVNETKEAVKLIKIDCTRYKGVFGGEIISAGNSIDFPTLKEHGRYHGFMTWEGVSTGAQYRMAHVCPKRTQSHNRACGYGQSGLQKYKRGGTPFSITFKLGRDDEADWENDSTYNSVHLPYGICEDGTPD